MMATHSSHHDGATRGVGARVDEDPLDILNHGALSVYNFPSQLQTPLLLI